MIIWGSRTTNKNVSSGPFHCPRCGPEKRYDLIQVNRWFTLYFIPLIPMGSEGKYVKCKACAGTFDETAVNYDPVVAQEEFVAKLDSAIVRSLLILAQAAPPVTDEVMLAIADVMERTRARDMELPELWDLMSEIQSRKMTIKIALSPVATSLSDEGSRMVIQILAMDAPAMLPQQRKLIEEAGVYLGFSKKALAPLFVPALTN